MCGGVTIARVKKTRHFEKPTLPKMTLRFVKTSVLSSSDGIDFSNEVAVESEETKMARVAAERAAARPLFEQLAEQRQKKQDEYDANTKLMFAPPKSLDAEDITFLQGVQDSQQAIQRRRKEEEELALEQFRAATRKEAPAHVPVVHTVKVAVPEKKAVPVSTVIRG